MADRLTPSMLRDLATVLQRHTGWEAVWALREEAARREAEQGSEAPASADSLVARIRTAAPGRGTNFVGDLALEAADRIEALTKLIQDNRAVVLAAMTVPEGFVLVPKDTFMRLFTAACELVNQADDPPHKYPGTDIDMLDAPKWAFDNVGDMIDAIDSECSWIKDAYLDAAPEPTTETRGEKG